MIDEVDVSPKCRMCGGADETVSHIVSECKQLAQNEYRKCRQNKIERTWVSTDREEL